MKRHLILVAAIGLIPLLAACGGHSDRMEITAQRTASKPTLPAVPGATSAQRFGGSMPSMPAGGGAGASAETGLAFETPAGWEELPASSLRPGG